MVAKKTILFHGDPVIKLCEEPDDHSCVGISVYWPVTYNGKKYEKLPILTLLIHHTGTVQVYDTYLPWLPDLKAIPAFRTSIVQYLNDFVINQNSETLLTVGIRLYWMRIRTSDIEVLVEQAKRSVAAFDPVDKMPDIYATATARAILAAMDETPGCDVQMQHEK